MHKGIITPRIGLGVKKVGRTTELTSGILLYTNVTLTINYPPCENNTLFTNLIITSAKSKPGDSGALLLDANNYAIAFLISKISTTDYSTYCPIRSVLDALNVRLVTSEDFK